MHTHHSHATPHAFIDAAKKSLSTPSPDPQSTVVRPSQKTDRPSPAKLTFSLSFVPQSYLFLHLFSRAQVVSELHGYSNSRYKNKSHTTWENQDTLGIATPNGRRGEHSLLSPSSEKKGGNANNSSLCSSQLVRRTVFEGRPYPSVDINGSFPFGCVAEISHCVGRTKGEG